MPVEAHRDRDRRAEIMTHDQDERAILAQERRALERWSQGQPLGYVDIQAEDSTYFDDIGAQRRLDGIDAVRSYLASLEGKIPPHRYEVADPKVQIYGDTAILTLRYEPSTGDGSSLPPWKATSVYRRTGGAWRIVHAHRSVVKES
jgi:ketosteroid isomerase-like protein